MNMKVGLGKLNTVSSLVRLYFLEKNEWFYHYKLSFYSFGLGSLWFIFYVVLGNFSGSVILWKLFILVILGHVVMSIYGVLNDYIFNLEVKNWCKGLWLILCLRMLVEILVW